MKKISIIKLIEKFNGKCFHCSQNTNENISKLIPTRDHVIPRSLNGGNNFDNLVLSCANCNSLRGSFSIEEFHSRIKDNNLIVKEYIDDYFYYTWKKHDIPELHYTLKELFIKNSGINPERYEYHELPILKKFLMDKLNNCYDSKQIINIRKRIQYIDNQLFSFS